MSLPKDLSAYGKFDSVVAVGQTVYRDLTSAPVKWFLPRRKTALIPNGIDLRVFAPTPGGGPAARAALQIADTEHVVLSVSRLHSQKGLDKAILGFDRYAKHDDMARFLIVGDGPDRPRLEGLARNLGLMGRVCFAGSVPRTEVPRYLRAADAFLFTSTHREGLPLNVLEALAAGLPCLVSEHLADVVPGAGNAVRGVRTTDPDDIARALGEIQWERRDRQSLLPPQYTLAHCAKQYLDLMDRLASERAADAARPTTPPPGQDHIPC